MIKQDSHSPNYFNHNKIKGVLPLIPIFAGLSAFGGLVSRTYGILKAVNAVNTAKQQLH